MQLKPIQDLVVAVVGASSGIGRETAVHAPSNVVFAPFDQIKAEAFKRAIEVSLLGQVYGTMAALPYLKREGWGFQQDGCPQYFGMGG